MKHKIVKQIFDVVELALISWIGFFLMKFMYDFSKAMEAWSELHRLLQ
tara:strand:+ start:445 stop:588 length:144 start_codon:yes stop_codon:yes gene_type:complete